MRAEGRKPYIIPLGPSHPPLGELGYVVAAQELLTQIEEREISVDEIVVGAGSAATHARVLFGLRALGSTVSVTGIGVRRDAALQQLRVTNRCEGIARLLDVDSPVTPNDVQVTDDFLAPGYAVPSQALACDYPCGAHRRPAGGSGLYRVVAVAIRFAFGVNY